MLKFSANIDFLFTELPFYKRISAAKKFGFTGIESLFPYTYDIKYIKQLLDDNQISQVLFNFPPGDLEKGERGIAIFPDREKEFLDGLHKTIESAQFLNCSKLHMMSGIIKNENNINLYFNTYLKNLETACKVLEDTNINILIEPINNFDMPNYFIDNINRALDIINTLQNSRVGLQCDIYHLQKTNGNIIHNLFKNFKIIKHIQIAGVPDRYEPNIGELNFDYIFKKLADYCYEHWIGCEYNPKCSTLDSLGWIKKFL